MKQRLRYSCPQVLIHFILRWEYRYTADGKILEQKSYKEDGTFTWEIAEYDINGNVTSKSKHKENGSIDCQSRIEYNKEGDEVAH